MQVSEVVTVFDFMEASSPALSGEPVWGATVFRLAQTVPDGVIALIQGGSPFDCAGRRPTYRIRMACKRSAVRARLAPSHGISAVQSIAERGGWPRRVGRSARRTDGLPVPFLQVTGSPAAHLAPFMEGSQMRSPFQMT